MCLRLYDAVTFGPVLLRFGKKTIEISAF